MKIVKGRGGLALNKDKRMGTIAPPPHTHNFWGHFYQKYFTKHAEILSVAHRFCIGGVKDYFFLNGLGWLCLALHGIQDNVTLVLESGRPRKCDLGELFHLS